MADRESSTRYGRNETLQQRSKVFMRLPCLRKQPSFRGITHRDILGPQEGCTLSFFFLDFPQSSSHRIAKVAFRLRELIGLLPGACMGGDNPLPAVLADVESLPAVAAFTPVIPIGLLGAVRKMACEGGDRAGVVGSVHACIAVFVTVFLKITFPFFQEVEYR
jgi:hypothetical protein